MRCAMVSTRPMSSCCSAPCHECPQINGIFKRALLSWSSWTACDHRAQHFRLRSGPARSIPMSNPGRPGKQAVSAVRASTSTLQAGGASLAAESRGGQDQFAGLAGQRQGAVCIGDAFEGVDGLDYGT